MRLSLSRSAWQRMAMTVLVASLTPVLAAPSATVETSLAERACRRPAPAVVALYASRDLGVVQCPAPAGFTLLLVSSDANSWIELKHGKSVWSSEEAVVYRKGAGAFPNVTGNLIWLRAPSRTWRGLVFTVASRDENEARQLVYFAVKTTERTCLAGVFSSRNEAEQALQTNGACQ